MRVVLVVALLMALSARVAAADETGAAAPAQTTLDVTVLGRVQQAGHYTLAAGARLFAAILAAGGERPAETAIVYLEALTAFAAPHNARRVFLMRTFDGQRITYQINVDRTPYDVRYSGRVIRSTPRTPQAGRQDHFGAGCIAQNLEPSDVEFVGVARAGLSVALERVDAPPPGWREISCRLGRRTC